MSLYHRTSYGRFVDFAFTCTDFLVVDSGWEWKSSTDDFLLSSYLPLCPYQIQCLRVHDQPDSPFSILARWLSPGLLEKAHLILPYTLSRQFLCQKTRQCWASQAPLLWIQAFLLSTKYAFCKSKALHLKLLFVIMVSEACFVDASDGY